MTNAKFTPTIVLDFDGVIHSYTSGWVSIGVIPDAPVPGAMEFILDLVGSGAFKVAIHSSRSSDVIGLGAMQQWLIEHMAAYLEGLVEGGRPDTAARELVFQAIDWPTTKPAAWLTIDDRAWTFMGRWPRLEELAAFKPWNKRSTMEEAIVLTSKIEAVAGLEIGPDDSSYNLRDVLEKGFAQLGAEDLDTAVEAALVKLVVFVTT